MTKLSKDKIYEVDLSQIDEPDGVVRLEIHQGEISELAQSISEIGQLQAIVLRKSGERFEIVAGHRRFLAHKYLEKGTIKATINEMNGQQAAISRATENLSRVDLTPVEEGAIYSNLINGHGMTVDQIAKRMGKSAGIVKRRLDILGMPPILQKAVHSGEISVGIAEELWRISDPGDQEYYLGLAIDNGVTRRVMRDWVKDWKRSRERGEDPGDDGGGVSPPYLERPVYVSCDLCGGPMQLGDETVIRACPDCEKQLRNALKGS